ncbi:hypothetical protein [Halobellus inordinatus]|uniref:hypothetical protein n=1 Tax=Halobellus inordinatus TaxID=1126236 RepID=UPI00210B7C00|nr:hypothetical protein [Halobellus inordinatus]
MFQVRCLNCGATENDRVEVSQSPKSGLAGDGDRTLSQSLKTEFQCSECGATDIVETGVHPTSHSDAFETVRETGESSLELKIDDQAVEFQSIDEKISEDAHYTPDGVQGTSRVRHIHIQVRDPPTFSKGWHTITLGDYIDDDLILGTVRYHDQTHRTLKFYKPLDSGHEDRVSAIYVGSVENGTQDLQT